MHVLFSPIIIKCIFVYWLYIMLAYFRKYKIYIAN